MSSQKKRAGPVETAVARWRRHQAQRRAQAKAQKCLSTRLTRQEKQAGVASAKEMKGKLESAWEGLCMPKTITPVTIVGEKAREGTSLLILPFPF